MTEITTQWMQMMVERQYPPLTPHHTQAFTVLMMSHFYGDYLGGNEKLAQFYSTVRVAVLVGPQLAASTSSGSI